MKRAFDIVVSCMGLAMLAAPFALIALAIKLSSQGPILYRQQRIGRGGRPFGLYKFRTMRAVAGGPLITVEGDARITSVGRVLRRWKLDELPQLLNVLRGEMSIVGPRPEVERFVRFYTPAQRRLLRQTPGLAGLSQLVYPHEADLLGGCADPEAVYVQQLMPRKLAVDLQYEESRTFRSDLWLLAEIALLILGKRDRMDRSFRLTPLAEPMVQPGVEEEEDDGVRGYAEPPVDLPLIRIEPPSGWVSIKPGELWDHRELLYFLLWRDIKARYKQTVLGVAWAIIQPFSTMVVFSLFFGRLGNMPSDGLPYTIFSYAGLVPWTFFATGLSQSSNSLVNNANMIKKVYFPRLVVPISAVCSGLMDFLPAFLVLLGMMGYYRVVPGVNALWLPLLFLLALVTALAVGVWLAALNVQFRDVRHVLPFVVQIWLFLTPIAYPSSLLSEPWRTIYVLNPMVGVVEGFRWALLGTDTAPGLSIVVSSLVALAVLVGGMFYFRRMERTFADII